MSLSPYFGLMISAILISSCLSEMNPRIIGGSEAQQHEWPMIVPLMVKKGFRQFCGGTIISKKHVLTAGHCMFQQDAASPRPVDTFGVVYGAHNILKVKESDIISPIKALLHKQYKFEVHYDLCILEMNEIKFSETVAPACIPSGRFDFSNKILDHMGWGLTKAGKFGATKLQKTKLHVVERSVCDQTYASTDYLNKDEIYQVCTSQPGTSQCQGDSGGPVQWLNPDTQRYNLVGAISFGWPSCDKPSVITDVTYFTDWIQKTVKAEGATVATCK